jgi:hypothetical protein
LALSENRVNQKEMRRVTKGRMCHLQTWEHRGEAVSVCSGQRNEQGGRNIIHMGCRKVVGNEKKSQQQQTGSQERKGRVFVDGCLERAELVPEKVSVPGPTWPGGEPV